MESFVTFFTLAAIYFAPTFIARKGRRSSVFVVNAFFGWTLIAWGIALYMAARSREEKVA